MKKILFLLLPSTPHYKLFDTDNSIYRGVFEPSLPLGISCISSFLKNKTSEIDIEAIDFTVLLNNMEADISSIDYESFIISSLQEYADDPPDFIGISAMYNIMYTNVVYTSGIIKQLFPSTIVVVGGALVSTMYKKLITEAPHIDALCYGDGEIPFFELITSNNPHEYLNSSKTWITLNKITDDPNIEYEAQQVDDYDSLPFPDYDLFGLDNYQKFSRDHSMKDSKCVGSVIFSRGCPFDCNFCVANTVHGKKVRYYSSDQAKKYIEYMIEKHHVTGLTIEDNNFLFNKKWAKEILSFLTQKNIEIDLTNGIYINSLNEDIVQHLKDAKINNMLFPLESGSERVLKELMNKHTNLAHAKKMIAYCHDQGMQVQANFIVGYPGETLDDIEATISFIKDVGVFDWVRFFPATPFHGSHLYDLCKEKGYLITDSYEMYSGDFPIIKTPDFTPDDIRYLSYKLNLLFNFVNNYRMKIGDYKRALIRFKQVEKKVNGHAFAMYYSGVCYEKLGQLEKAKELFDKYNKCVLENKEWKMWSEFFSLPCTVTNK